MTGKEIFISGIDTDCGKTYITGLLAYHARQNGLKAITTKLIQTGCNGISEDILEHRRIMGTDILTEDKNMETCPYVLSFPASPHLACRMDDITPDLNIIRKSHEKLKSSYDVVFCEGAGGISVPITEEYLISDYISDFSLPVILVSSSRLGSINHTLLNLGFCKENHINLQALIFNQFPSDSPAIAESSFSFIKHWCSLHFPGIAIVHSDILKKENKTDVGILLVNILNAI